MKITQRSISEVGQAEKVQIHFKFNDLKQGYAEIARVHGLDNSDIYMVVREIDNIREFRRANPQLKHVMRRVFINRKKEKAKAVVATPKRERRPDNKRNAINGAMALAFQEAGLV